MTFAGIGVSVLLALVWFLRHLEINRTFREDPILKPDSYRLPDNYDKLVSVLIPARNEENNIRGCVMSVLESRYPRKEIIVIDDRSDDRTAEIVEELGREHPEVKLVRVTHLRDGWIGKAHAIHEGVKIAKGDWFLFIDADTLQHPMNLETVIGYAEEKTLDLVTLLPLLASHSFWEKLMQPILGGALMLRFPLKKVNDPSSPMAFANGQYILVRPEAYNKVGGHESVAGEMVEDICLARVFKSNGFRIATAYGTEILTTRMYSSLKDICTGWPRIFYFALDCSLAKVSLGLFLIAFFSLLPYALFVGAGWRLIATGFSGAAVLLLGLNALTVFLLCLALWRVFNLTRHDKGFILLYPLGAILSCYIKLKTIALSFNRNGIRWRGTVYRPEKSNRL